MKKLYRILLFFFIPLSVLVVSCKDDEEPTAAPSPTITSVSPEEGPIGTEVTLSGTNMANVERVLFGGVEAEYTSTETSITTTVPEGVTPGELQLAVYLPNGSDRVAFRVLSVPTVTEINPTSGLPGSEVTVTGNYLNDITGVRFGDAQAEFSASDAGSLTFTVPVAAAPGSSTVTFTSRGGSADGTFEVLADPAITSVDPVDGNVGAEVTITGVNFIDVQSVMLGDLELEDYTVDNTTSITFTVPDGAAGGIVTVTTAEGTAASEEPFTVIYEFPINVDPVANQDLVIFDFDDRTRGWGDAGEITDSPAYTLDGSNYLRINQTLDGWSSVAAVSVGEISFDAESIGTDVSDYAVKFDIYIIEPITAGMFRLRIGGPEGDFWYNYQPWEGMEGGYQTDGWITVTVPLTDFVDNYGYGTNTISDLSSFTGEWGINWEGGPSKVNVAIDNYRVENITDDGGGDNGPVIDYYIFDDAIHADWEHWGWEVETDPENTENSLDGNAIRVAYTGEWSGYQAHHQESNFDLSGYNTLVFSIYGGESSGDVQVFIKDADGVDHPPVAIPVVAGEYTLYEIPLSDLDNPGSINELVFQNTGTVGNVIYIDNIGLR